MSMKLKINIEKRQSKENIVTGNIARPNGAVVAAISAETLAVISEPNSGSVIFSTRE